MTTKDYCIHHYCQLLPHEKMKVIWEEMWLVGFHLRSSKKIDVHMEMHVNEVECKVLTLEIIDVYYTAWYIIHCVFKFFYRQVPYAKEGCRSRKDGNLG